MRHILIFLSLTAAMLSFVSCDVINPAEEIPSYIAVDTLALHVEAGQGTALHNISDCWLYVDNKLIGVFEVPFKVPVLSSGQKNIQIEPGILNSGSDSDRSVYPFLWGYETDTLLVAGKVLTLQPYFRYREKANFLLVEDFEDISTAFEVSDATYPDFEIVKENACQGHSMHVVLTAEHPDFECKSIVDNDDDYDDLFDFTRDNIPFLEIHFNCNTAFEFGLFELKNDGLSAYESRIKDMTYIFKPTKNCWRKVYINLSSFLNVSTASKFRLYFRSVYSANDEGKNDIYIDNVKLLSMPSR